ncbi:gliding motility lipoprotein GldD [Mucilaginibacter sp.]|uniref:gliding motility lipoprotein GldD n=1 Tax=Mucilaginibacter sp. TaxID=1882438 RepID=UPI003D14CB45
MRKLVLPVLMLLLFAACDGNHDYSPKPRGYYRIVFPKKDYQPYKGNGPFTFLYPKYAVIDTDKTSRRSAKLLNMKSLLNMQFPQFNGTLHLSYESIPSKKVFNELIEDAHAFAFKHTIKATGIDQGTIYYPDHKVYGIYYTIDGNAASSIQFYLTDSTRNYIRGALYFNSEPKLDSIQPVLSFVKKDVDLMIKSFRWK